MALTCLMWRLLSASLKFMMLSAAAVRACMHRTCQIAVPLGPMTTISLVISVHRDHYAYCSVDREPDTKGCWDLPDRPVCCNCSAFM